MPPQATQPSLTVTRSLAVVPEGTSTAKFAVNEYGDGYFAGAVRIDGELQLSGGGTPGLTLGNNEFLAGLTTANVVKRLIGVNASNVVSIDADGLGVVFGGSVSFSSGSLSLDDLTVTNSITLSALTAGRVLIAGTAGLITDDAAFTYSAANNSLSIVSGAMTSAVPSLTITGTLSSTNAEQTGVSFIVTGSGSGVAAVQNALRVGLSAGYTGGASTFGIQLTNASAGTGTGASVQASANYGIAAFVSGTTAGDNAGVSGAAANGNRNFGGAFIAPTNKAGATNGGVVGLGLNGGGGGALQFGGYFALLASTPTYASAALIANNGAQTDPIFIAQNNGTAVFTIADDNSVTITGILTGTAGAPLIINAPAGQQLQMTAPGSLVLTGAMTVSSTLTSTGGFFTGAGRIGATTEAFGAGTAYALTNSAAAIDFGTTDPAIVIPQAGTYLISGQVNLAYNGATVVAETATIKVRRTNNTAADLSPVVVLDLPAATTLTHTYGVFVIPPFVYTTAATDDAITLFANVSAALGAGTIDATAIGTSISATRIY